MLKDRFIQHIIDKAMHSYRGTIDSSANSTSSRYHLQISTLIAWYFSPGCGTNDMEQSLDGRSI